MANYMHTPPRIDRGVAGRIVVKDQYRVVAYTSGMLQNDVEDYLSILFETVANAALAGEHIVFGGLFEINANRSNRLIKGSYQLPKPLGYYAASIDDERIAHISLKSRLYILLNYLEMLERELLRGVPVVVHRIASIKERPTGIIGIAISEVLTERSKELGVKVKVRLQTPFKYITMKA